MGVALAMSQGTVLEGGGNGVGVGGWVWPWPCPAAPEAKIFYIKIRRSWKIKEELNPRALASALVSVSLHAIAMWL